MKSIEMNQALVEAIQTTEVLGASALEETRVLRQLVASANARIEELETAAVEQAKSILSSLSCASEELCSIERPVDGRRTNRGEVSKFLFDGHHFELRKAETFDFVGKPQKYTMPEGVAFRQKTAEQAVLKSQSSVITKILKTLRDNFPKQHPNIAPDSVEYTLVCVD